MAYMGAPPHRLPGAGAWNRFNLPGYAGWASIACPPLWRWLHGTEHSPLMPYAAFGLLGMLALFVLRAELDARDFPLVPRCATVVGQLALALLSCWALRSDMAPGLLVICAPQVGSRFPRRTVLPVLLATNAVFAALAFSGDMLHDDSLTEFIAYGCFQAFAAVGASYAWRLLQTQETMLRMNAELLSTRHLLDESARAEERLHLSRELHDVAGHKLTALKMQLAAHGLRPGAHPAIADWEHLTDEVLTDIRAVVGALRQHDGVDLQQALRALDPGLPRPTIHFSLDPAIRIADMRQAETLLRSAQEGLTNALRHSAAANVRLSLACAGEGVAVTVEDDGTGRVERLVAGNGLRGLQERLEGIGGRLELRNRAPSGVVLTALLPQPDLVQLEAVVAREGHDAKIKCTLRDCVRTARSLVHPALS
ncbi:MAG: histidine kinase [Nevskia sp.]|nr:histidine kinase [Nevskia sp.]